jgi:hypothetical protein
MGPRVREAAFHRCFMISNNSHSRVKPIAGRRFVICAFYTIIGLSRRPVPLSQKTLMTRSPRVAIQPRRNLIQHRRLSAPVCFAALSSRCGKKK